MRKQNWMGESRILRHRRAFPKECRSEGIYMLPCFGQMICLDIQSYIYDNTSGNYSLDFYNLHRTTMILLIHLQEGNHQIRLVRHILDKKLSIRKPQHASAFFIWKYRNRKPLVAYACRLSLIWNLPFSG